ncbi:MAG TPA: hypothetical protein VGQ62_18140 [Chloroflexota bacterium]|nr:hypothetical protein [Chloroflexota bacterium]
MTPFERVLRIAQEQMTAVEQGDLESAVARLDERATLLASAPPALPEDTHIIEQILHLDRILSNAIRERMVAIRDEALEGERGRRALGGYAVRRSDRPRVLDAVG